MTVSNLNLNLLQQEVGMGLFGTFGECVQHRPQLIEIVLQCFKVQGYRTPTLEQGLESIDTELRRNGADLPLTIAKSDDVRHYASGKTSDGSIGSNRRAAELVRRTRADFALS
jgi:hypothetical protein